VALLQVADCRLGHFKMVPQFLVLLFQMRLLALPVIPLPLECDILALRQLDGRDGKGIRSGDTGSWRMGGGWVMGRMAAFHVPL